MTTSDSSLNLLPPVILSRICSFSSTKELKHLAITNKHFSAPAIQKLWRTLPSFAPLVDTLPPDAWKSSNTRVNNVRYHMKERTFVSQPLQLLLIVELFKF